MKVKFNKFERVAGIFVLATIVGATSLMIGLAVKKGWFDPRVSFKTEVPTAEGLSVGAKVQMSGLRVGEVVDIELQEDRSVMVYFYVFSKYRSSLRQDSRIQLVRPFLIGERVLDVTVGSMDLPLIKEGQLIETEASFDIMDLASGRKLGPLMQNMQKVVDSMAVLVEAFSNVERTENLVRSFDTIYPVLKNLERMSWEGWVTLKGLNKGRKLDQLVGNLNDLTGVLHTALPEIKDKIPSAASEVTQLITNLNALTKELSVLTPTLTAVAPKLPDASLRAIEALDEAVVVLKTIQKSWFFKSHAEKVREEEAQQRLPASKGK